MKETHEAKEILISYIGDSNYFIALELVKDGLVVITDGHEDNFFFNNAKEWGRQNQPQLEDYSYAPISMKYTGTNVTFTAGELAYIMLMSNDFSLASELKDLIC